ncbi:MAG: phosphate signaling complex protein PhoU [Ignavibacteria bacterium]|nr:phosphate signaling complex protein PhoU [Ignavibacteria bacterium]
MQKHFEVELEDLKKTIIKMASLVDEMVEDAFTALTNCDTELCQSIFSRDREVDAYDVLIQTKIENIFALFQPVAIDLRYLITALMVNNQLERCGDIAVNIAQRVAPTKDVKSLLIETEIFDMGKNARQMVKDAIDSFINKDIELARSIGAKDNIVDSYNKKIFRKIISKMASDKDIIEPAAHLLILSRHIERLADHATNIAEDVIFMIEAKIVTHMHKLGNLNMSKESK